MLLKAPSPHQEAELIPGKPPVDMLEHKEGSGNDEHRRQGLVYLEIKTLETLLIIRCWTQNVGAVPWDAKE